MQRLISVVFTLRYDAIVPYGEFSGRRAQRLFFDLLRTVAPALVDASHDDNSPLIYSISSLIYMADNVYWMRVASAEPRLVAALAEICAQPLSPPFLTARTSEHEWARDEQLDAIVRRIWRRPPPATLLLDIHSPTSMHSLGLYRPLPDPPLLFRSLFQRWRQFGLAVPAFTPDAALWELYTQYHLGLQDAQRLTLHSIDHKKGEPIPAFSGILQVRRYGHSVALWQTARRNFERYDAHLLEQAERIRARRDDLARWVHLLAYLAFYSGIGVRTGWGMGMARLLDDARSP